MPLDFLCTVEAIIKSQFRSRNTHNYCSCKSYEAFSRLFPIVITAEVALAITRRRFWASERRCSAGSAAVVASHSWTRRKSRCCLHICVWVSAQRPEGGTLLYFIGRSRTVFLTGRQMCGNKKNRGDIHITEAPAVSRPHQWTYCCSATFSAFGKSCRTNKAAATGTLKRGDGKVAGLFIRQDFEGRGGVSARDADSPEDGSTAP